MELGWFVNIRKPQWNQSLWGVLRTVSPLVTPRMKKMIHAVSLCQPPTTLSSLLLPRPHRIFITPIMHLSCPIPHLLSQLNQSVQIISLKFTVGKWWWMASYENVDTTSLNFTFLFNPLHVLSEHFINTKNRFPPSSDLISQVGKYTCRKFSIVLSSQAVKLH